MKKGFYILLLFMILSGCKSKSSGTLLTDLKSDSDEPAYGDTLIEGTIGEPSILIPMLAGDSASHNIAGLVYNGLVKYDTDLSVIGDLAESWEISKDGLVITFHLRKGVKWADGVEFTADDVMFGYKTIIDEKTPTAYSEDFRQVKKAEVLDRYTFRVTYGKPFARHLLHGQSCGASPASSGRERYYEKRTRKKPDRDGAV